MAQPRPYDAIVLDVMLPDFDGFEIVRGSVRTESGRRC